MTQQTTELRRCEGRRDRAVCQINNRKKSRNQRPKGQDLGQGPLRLLWSKFGVAAGRVASAAGARHEMLAGEAS